MKTLAVLLATLMAIIAAPLAPASAQDEAPPTIAEIAVATPELSTLVTALSVATNAGPVDFLGVASDPAADLTVFAPTNAAFAALGPALDDVLADPSGALTNILLYHVLGTSETGADLVAAGTATTLLGDNVTIEIRDGNVFINDSQVVIADIQAANGIVHVIDTVLLPPTPEPPAPLTIAEIAVATPELSTLVTALSVATNAGPVDFLGVASDPAADLTVFAPTNAAFAALGPALDDVLADPSGALTNILLYHVLGTSETGADLVAAGTATTLLGDNVTIEIRDGNVFINDSQVVIADIQAANGIVHVIDTVLLPPTPEPPAPLTIAEIAVATPELSTLVTALSVATNAGPVDFLGVASDPAADLTVFAPTNAAFAALGPALDDVLADPSGALTNILLYHVLGTSETGADLVAAGTATTLLGDNVTIEIRDGNVFINDSQVVIADIQAANGIVHVIDTVLLPPTPEEPSPIFEGARLNIVSAVSDRYLDGDASYYRTNVDTSTTPRLDDEWILEPTPSGNWRLLNAQRHLYLDADGRHRSYNVDLANRHAFGTEWEITELDNGNYWLRSVAYNRYLDYDRDENVETSFTPKADDEWQLVLLAGH